MMILQSRSPTRAGTLVIATGALALGLSIGALLGPQIATSAVSADAPAAAPASAPDQRAAFRLSHPAQVVRVIDGDTFEARVGVWPGLEITTKVRLRGIDAPELRARCPDEIAKAQAARDALSAILAEGAVGVSQVALDKYGGRVIADAQDPRRLNRAAARRPGARLRGRPPRQLVLNRTTGDRRPRRTARRHRPPLSGTGHGCALYYA
jgi:endonuclease YncB( thermonuclease family)